VKNGIKKDLVSILSQKNTKEELDFLKKLTNFMEKRNTPIERPPMLGFKQSKKSAILSCYFSRRIYTLVLVIYCIDVK
jgi:hypothetical protein